MSQPSETTREVEHNKPMKGKGEIQAQFPIYRGEIKEGGCTPQAGKLC